MKFFLKNRYMKDTERERNTILRTKLYTVKGPDHSADKGYSLIKHFCQREP